MAIGQPIRTSELACYKAVLHRLFFSLEQDTSILVFPFLGGSCQVRRLFAPLVSFGLMNPKGSVATSSSSTF